MAIKTLDPAFTGNSFESAQRLADAQRDAQPRPVAPALYPLLVGMKDRENVDTLQLVDPRDLSGSFRAGVVLSSIAVDLTDLPVTLGIENRLA